jgi:hypothetical protein
MERISELGTTLAVTSNRSTLVFLRIVLQFLFTANIIPSSLLLTTLMMDAIRSSEMSVLARVTRPHIQNDGILHSHQLLHSINRLDSIAEA